MTAFIAGCKIQPHFILLHDGWSGLRDSDIAFIPDGCLWLGPPWLKVFFSSDYL